MAPLQPLEAAADHRRQRPVAPGAPILSLAVRVVSLVRLVKASVVKLVPATVATEVPVALVAMLEQVAVLRFRLQDAKV